MVNRPPSITSEPPTKTVSVLSVKASSTKAFRPGTTAAVNLNTRLPQKRQILPSMAVTRDVCLKTLATRRPPPFYLLLHHQLPPRRLRTGRSNMLTEKKAHSRTIRKSSLRAWTSQAIPVASSDLGNCSLETLTGMDADLLLPLLPLSLQRNFRWTATSWTRAAAMVIAVVRGLIASVQHLAKSSDIQTERHADQTVFEQRQDLWSI